MTTYDKLDTINDSLNDIKSAILAKGQTPNGNITTYAEAIGNINTVNNTTLTVTPTTSSQNFSPSSPYTGYSSVSVNAVTSSIDNNIVAGNIKSGVEILGVTGNYAATNPSGTISIESNGTYDVTNYASASVSVSGASTVALTIIIVSHPQMANEDEIDLGGTWYNVWTDFSWYSTVGNMGGMVHYKLFNVPKNTDIHYEDTQGYTGVINISEPSIILWVG